MEVIETGLLATHYTDHQALFFLEEGIFVDAQTASPLLSFGKTVHSLDLVVERAYLSDSTLMLRCQSSLPLDQIVENGFDIHNPKALLTFPDEKIQHLVLRAAQWLAWDEKLQYCSKCGGKVQKGREATEKRCNTCNLSFFPKFSPAVMVLIQRDREVLLARSAHFKPGIYSALAGFVDMGETAEEAAHREVKEEVGLEISNLEYFGTQSWPFPDVFMIAFKAKYVRGEINIDVNELEDARWFDVKNLPELPSYASISRRLIESFIAAEME